MTTYPSTQTRPAIPVDAPLFDEQLHLTDIADYGVSMPELLTGQTSPPLEGARFDIFYEGRIEGERLSGTITGVDYARARADGRFQLDIHARITTDDGAPIALYADGIMKAPDANGIAELRLNMTLSTSVAAYTWVNGLQVWATGSVNLETGQIRVSTYSA